MIHVCVLEIPANTPVTDPEQATVKLGSCIIRRVGVEFPRGCYWLAGVRMILRAHQLYPTTPGEWLHSEGQLISFGDNTAVIDPPYEVLVEGYNLDERYPHTIRIYLDVEEISGPGIGAGEVMLESGYMG